YCLLLIDIDHFKSINDIHGHQKGDEVLLVISRILETSVDREDKIYRWGGEEVLLFLPQSPIGRALILAEGIRQAVSEYQ
ncbi:GGDEF domain-containing protein, partial [Escherichia coli]|uniref:GGDEF domain-containing protein n=1 Tax=Escherichia coli TaxID=562 RepID=UPI001CD048DD